MTTAVEKHSDTPYEGVVEIRIHGVSGTPPAELLDRQVVTAVAGDQSAGFYQPAVDSQRRDRPHGSPRNRGPWLEAFSWAGLTSGSASRALWILLLPFGLINIAPYAVPGPAIDEYSTSWRQWHGRVLALCRLLAGTLTAALALGACGVGMLTMGTRCATIDQVRGCYGIPLWISDMLGAISPVGQWATGAIVPLLAVAGLMLISRRSDRGEAIPEPLHATATAGGQGPVAIKADPESVFELARPGMWTSGLRARRQRGIHGQIALLVIGLVGGWPLTESSILRWPLVAAAGVVLACDVALLLWGHTAFDAPRGMRLHVTGWVAVYALGVIAMVACFPASSTERWNVLSGEVRGKELMEWFDQVLRFGFIAQGLIVIAIIVSVGMIRLRTEPRQRHPLDRAHAVPRRFRRLFLRGWSTAVFAVGAWLLGGASTTALMIVVPAWMATPGLIMGPNALARTMAAHPDWFASSVGSSGFAILVVVIIGLVAAVCCLLWVAWFVWMPWGAGRKIDRDHVVEVYGTEFAATTLATDDAPAAGATTRTTLMSSLRNLRRPRFESWPDLTGEELRRAVEVARIFWWARRIDYVPRLIGVVGGISAGCLLVVFVVDEVWTNLFRWVPAASSAFRDGEARPKGLTGAIAWGIWLAAFGLIVVVLLSLLATRDSSLRRHIGIVWDVASFWPRDTHPLAPPCYSERAIPQLVHRIRYYVGDLPDQVAKRSASTDAVDSDDPPERRVIIAGHSQGSVIGVAAVMNLPPSAQSKVALLTYGSVLSRLYSRFFPLYFGPAELANVADAVRDDRAAKIRWRNLYRYSDFLGGPIDRQSDDPPELADLDRPYPDPLFRSLPGDSIYPAAGRHSRFERDPSFQREIGWLVDRFGKEEYHDPYAPVCGGSEPDGSSRPSRSTSRPSADERMDAVPGQPNAGR